jgi:hypothetical protein
MGFPLATADHRPSIGGSVRVCLDECGPGVLDVFERVGLTVIVHPVQRACAVRGPWLLDGY